jgi:hypothetical protein
MKVKSCLIPAESFLASDVATADFQTLMKLKIHNLNAVPWLFGLIWVVSYLIFWD